jgi:ParB-like chromosome segregation protein Spo0J
MRIEKILINKLKPATYNPRQISKKQYNDLKDSLDKFSLVEPIVVNKDMTIIGGHQRYKIWKENAEQSNVDDITIPCVVLDLNKEQERELNIRLNKSGGEWDMDILANEFDIEELKEWGFKDIEFGFNIDKLEEPGLDELTDDLKNKPPTIKITFDNINDLKLAEKEIKQMIKIYNNSFYSVSSGEI